MLDIKFIRENIELVRKAIINKQVNANLDHLIALDDQRRKFIIETEAIRSRKNEISEILKKGKDEDLIKEGKDLKEKLAKLELEQEEVEGQWRLAMFEMPNIPMSDVPVGKDESENVVIHKKGELPKFKFEPKDHLALGEELDLIDVPRAAKVAGTRFGFWKRAAVLFEMALLWHFFKNLTDKEVIKKIADSVQKGYNPKPFVPILPPVFLRPEVYERSGRLSPQDKDDKYFINSDELYLIGSAEHTMVSMHMDEILDEKNLPLRYLGFSTAFRRESGSYGKDTRGMLRVHQFDKMEMESFTTPENGLLEHQFFIAVQEYIMQTLELPYQAVINCTGDMGKPNARQVDIETWFPGQGRYRETHSADFISDFQSRRLNIKIRRPNGTTDLVHTNDATGMAQRLILAIMENYQTEKGTIIVPKILVPYLGINEITRGE
jgi:seryl-tRNA synthetase